MSGTKILIDTDIAINIFRGDQHLAVLLQDTEAYISIVGELELLGYRAIPVEEGPWVEKFLNECIVIGLIDGIKEIAIYIQRQYNLTLPDAIIAATSIFLGIPLLSTDDHFERVKELIFIFYQP
ncbi:putative nucleic acid-binding protein [Dyadobacter sp. BE34]|uniref:Nucleic acid-binding protein n=1 Tax=Dyadobacter fermentans TaxID=94254 RepID=A0ABU1R3K7_9BACT|nr:MULTISPECIES: PIN domain-containing protein [Dyadobacter]MDR6807958.1 putative nucleic acid-binding protein [Dyadobacter fermentans]MDR7045699.1 putative nucleic acid-binding protein [Dyadobacter sp. BE242]MDR7200012.1 putative nucleic acid-binding protein [Dyadobacter sp. BE34]MDR7217529.1 putative nucleic acid-binding protein [Dyadobacter sp. BE31]MDR7265903.1 putative nucleic acid-binding protein [Dyadobacter sp. BE32]